MVAANPRRESEHWADRYPDDRVFSRRKTILRVLGPHVRGSCQGNLPHEDLGKHAQNDYSEWLRSAMDAAEGAEIRLTSDFELAREPHRVFAWLRGR